MATNPIDKIEHALIAVSPFNGYFSTENMELLFCWAKVNCIDFSVFTMNGASQYNLMAMGYEENEAIKKTRKQDRHLFNKVIKSLAGIGIDEKEAEKKILMFSQACHSEKYRELYKRCCDLFKNNDVFQSDCLNATKDVLTRKMDKASSNDVAIAVNYLLEELPIWFDANSIFNIPDGTLVYKDMPPFLYSVISRYSLLSPHQKILIKNVETDHEQTYPF